VLTSTLRTSKAGDERIRGSALQKIRERILTQACGLCQCEECGATGTPRRASVVDHIIPLWAGGSEDDSNRQAMSTECHDRKSAVEAAMRARGLTPTC
jgi:5-methylcytosine-specific restriction protein A